MTMVTAATGLDELCVNTMFADFGFTPDAVLERAHRLLPVGGGDLGEGAGRGAGGER